MEPTEQFIVRQLKRGEEWAYKYLYDHHYAVLCHIAAQYVHDDFLAETIVGDVVFHLWEIRETMDINTSLRRYLARSVRNRCLDYMKSQRHQREVSISGLQEFPLFRHSVSDDYPLGRLLDNELEEQVMLSIGHLPIECRTVFCMSRFDDKKNAEIAKELGISVNTVKYHIKRALSLLRADLGEYLTVVVTALLTLLR